MSTALAGQLSSLAETGGIAPSLLALALALGAVHALTPGHGKSIVLSYFLGHSARAVDGMLMASRVAFSHSLAAVLLVVLLGTAASKWGRPSGAAEILQIGSYAIITAMGLVYLYRAVRAQEPNTSPHLLPFAVGVLPCPLTMLIVGNAIAAGSLIGGIGLAAVVAIGATATISLFGAAGILLRRVVAFQTQQRTRQASQILTAMEVISSFAIFAIGAVFLIGALQAQ